MNIRLNPLDSVNFCGGFIEDWAYFSGSDEENILQMIQKINLITGEIIHLEDLSSAKTMYPKMIPSGVIE